MGSSGTSLSVNKSFVGKCQICEKSAHGKHYGATTCRACAAFFRRYATKKSIPPCKSRDNCGFLRNGWFNCKKCRLEKCRSFGMTNDTFQFDRDVMIPKNKVQVRKESIPQTMGTFLGRPNLIIFSAPNEKFRRNSKKSINLQYVIDNAAGILEETPESPLFASNSLGKLALGLQRLRRKTGKPAELVRKIGKEQVLELWNVEITKLAKWLTYFDEFRVLDLDFKIKMVKGMWLIWTRLENGSNTARERKEKQLESGMFILNGGEKNNLAIDFRNVDIDLSWVCRYTLEEMRLFIPINIEKCENFVQSMMELEPSDEELSFMMCQLCFYYLGKENQGQILKTCEKLQDVLSGNLHDYYMNTLRTSNYSSRVARMIKLNNRIQHDVVLEKSRRQLAEVFDCFHTQMLPSDMFRI